MSAPRNRKNNKDVEKTAYLTYDLKELAEKVMFEFDISFSQLVRDALHHYIKNVLFQKKQEDSRGKLPANCGGPNGLYTAEQVAQLIASMSKR